MMCAQFNEEIAKRHQEVLQLRKTEVMLASLHKERDAVEARVKEAEAALDKENRDYEKISQKSIVSIFYSVVGTLEERTEKERKEAVEAQLRYNQCLWDLEDVERQIARLESERLQYQDAEAEFDRLYQEKLRFLLTKNNRTAEKIMELGTRLEESKGRLREIVEAMAVGQEVLGSLEDVLASLSDAKDWGTWDMFVGGVMTSYVKHSHIDGANDHIQRTQSLLRRFRVELADVDITIMNDFGLNLSDFDRFADFFFDNFIVDWLIQNKIKDTQERVYTVQNQMTMVMKKLEDVKEQEETLCKSLDEELAKLIIEA